jgi:hypothetical protein
LGGYPPIFNPKGQKHYCDNFLPRNQCPDSPCISLRPGLTDADTDAIYIGF